MSWFAENADVLKKLNKMNRRELKVKQDFENEGFKTLRNGHPDFLFYKEKDGKIVEITFVEVKRPEQDFLTKEQVMYGKILRTLGADYQVIMPKIRGGKIRNSICLDEEIWEVIDKLRGDIALSTFVNKLLKDALKGRKTK